ncbi:uncharacterized protein LOC127138022 [Lathyrus oleraceus]|uniref:uncharacterized protein LOC127138022 n=1 Tax=Pisum sativum TaxID=3888 RepID=UPI0021CF91EE|nr:uncharacterized protein LOC127138022 [Pisum sativum]
MSQQSSPTHMHVPAETSGSSSPSFRTNAPFQMINLENLIFDVAPLSTVHPPPQKKVTPSGSKIIKTSGKSSEPIIPGKDKNVVEEQSRFKGYDLRNPSMYVDGFKNPKEVERSATDKELRKFVASVMKEVNSDVLLDVQTSLAKDPSPDNNSSEKVEESVLEHAAHERRSKKKVELVVNVDELTSGEEPIINIVTLSIAKRLQRRKGKTVAFKDSPSREVKRKSDGLKGTPSRSSTRKSLVGPTRSWSKVVTPTRKRKMSLINAERWKHVIQRRVALKRELGKDYLKCNEVMELIKVVGLMKIATHFGLCYENLVKKFMVTIPDGCDDIKSADYGKVYVRGNVVTFSPTVINKFLARINEPQAELEVTDDQETYKELEDSIRSSTANKIKLETLMKAMMEEEKKEVVQDGDANEGTDDENYVGEDDVDE